MRPLRFLALFLLVLALAPFFAPYDPLHSDIDSFGKLQPPSVAHPFGTDNLARDELSRVLAGAQLSLEISLTAVGIALFVGTLYGVLAAMAGGWTDALLMRCLDVALAIPRILLLLPIAPLWHGLPLAALIFVIGLTGWFDIARLIRGDSQSILRRDFVLATRATGIGTLRVLIRHLLPHLVPTLIVVGTLSIGSTIALEAGLAFLGLGLGVSAPSLGTLLNEQFAIDRWWLSVFPGITIVSIMLVCNLIGDRLRQRFSPPQLHA